MVFGATWRCASISHICRPFGVHHALLQRRNILSSSNFVVLLVDCGARLWDCRVDFDGFNDVCRFVLFDLCPAPHTGIANSGASSTPPARSNCREAPSKEAKACKCPWTQSTSEITSGVTTASRRFCRYHSEQQQSNIDRKCR